MRIGGFSKLWLLLAFALLATILGIGFAVHTARAKRARLDLKVPTPVLPNPNAFDVFCQAGDALVNHDKIVKASGTQEPLYLKQWAVSENPRAITILRQGFNCQYMHPPVRSLDTRFPYYPKWRNLARLLKEDSEVRMARGDWGNAANSALDAIHLGVTVPHGAPLIGTLVGMHIQMLGQGPMWSIIPHLAAGQAKETLKRLEFLAAHEVSTSDALQEELWYAYAGLQKDFIQDNKPLSPGLNGKEAPSSFSKKLRQTMLDVYTDAMLNGIENSRLPYVRQQALPAPTGLTALVADNMLLDSQKVSFRLTKNHTTNLLLVTALALQAYRCEHHRYPQTLQGLVPAYLSTSPDDPFADHGHFRYQLRGNSYLLYSVGPDGTDDDGTPLTKILDPKTLARAEEAESTGDIVAELHP